MTRRVAALAFCLLALAAGASAAVCTAGEPHACMCLLRRAVLLLPLVSA